MLDQDLSGVMKAKEDFDWQRVPFVLEIRGKHLEDYVAKNQDRARSAHAKSLEVAFQAWSEDLTADQTLFDSTKLLTLGTKTSL